jgi:carbamate kinase
VIALGGNALLPRGRPLAYELQRESAATAAKALEPVAIRHEVVLTHGNGPQVGLLALQAEAYPQGGVYPLDVLVAESIGMIGYILETELDRVLDRDVLTVLTRIVVDRDDPAFLRPSKPIGPVYRDEPAIRQEAEEKGWTMVADGGGIRRVVASPQPRRIVQARLIRWLASRGVLVICAGGGGVPVVEEDGHTVGVEAVIDKDLTSSLLAIELEADRLVCLTDVPAVVDGWGTPTARGISRISPALARQREFAAGSMGPKMEAACRFVEATGGTAVIGALSQAEAVASAEAGTLVEPACTGVEYYPGLGDG